MSRKAIQRLAVATATAIALVTGFSALTAPSETGWQRQAGTGWQTAPETGWQTAPETGWQTSPTSTFRTGWQ